MKQELVNMAWKIDDESADDDVIHEWNSTYKLIIC